MHKLLRVVLLFIFCINSIPAFCQNDDEFFCNLVDSLDRIKAPKLEKVKEKGCAFEIIVKNQQSFDNINQAIISAVNAGKKIIRVKVYKGLYHFRDGHISMSDLSYPDVSISIEGYNTIITSDLGYIVGKNFISPYDEMMVMDGPVIIVDTLRKLCKIPFNNKIDIIKRSQCTKVQITEWFKAPVYSIASIDETGIYFFAPDLEMVTIYKRQGYNVNYDCLYIEKIPRFRLYDQSKEPRCDASQFMVLNNCLFRKLSVRGIQFISNGYDKALIEINNVDTKLTEVTNCTFEYIRGKVLNASNSCNVSFNNNTVRNTGGNEVRFINNCPNVRVTNNLFDNCGQSIGNVFCVSCWESDYYIANNIFRDFCYGAIGIGVWDGYIKKWPSRGIIEYNEIYYTTNYFNNCSKHTLMDGGAIYLWTQNDNVIIRYNYIHDYIGEGNNRGIFCDAGACNLKIYGNVILNTPNCYSIDARREQELHDGFKNNENNLMCFNIIDGVVCFMGSEQEERHVIKGPNYIIDRKPLCKYSNKFSALELEADDIIIREDESINSIIRTTPLSKKKKLIKVVNRQNRL